MNKTASSLLLNNSSTDNNAPIEQTVIDEAIVWSVTLASGEVTTQQRTDFKKWHSAHPDHQRAWQRLQGMQQTLQVGAEIPALTRQVVRSVNQQQIKRRRMLKLLLGLSVLGGSALLVSRQPQLQGLLAQHRTATGERRTLILADGTEVLLNTATAISTVFHATQRLITLHYGAVQIITADDSRPLQIFSDDGSVQPLGTQLILQRYSDEPNTLLQVMEGSVMVRDSQMVRAGQQTKFTATKIDPLQSLDVAATAWVNGMLSAERMPLGQFLDALSRHRAGWLYYEPDVANLQITGHFPLDDTDRVLDALQRTLPIIVRRRSQYWVMVSRR